MIDGPSPSLPVYQGFFGMATYIFKRHIDAQPEVVFQLASDFARLAETIQGIEKTTMLTEGPVGVGTRFRETRVLFGKEATQELEVAAFDEPHGYTVDCESCGLRYRAAYHFGGDIAGTHVRLEVDCQPVTWMAKLMSPLSRLMMRPRIKCIEADLEDLKTVAEAKAKQLLKAEW